MHSMVKREGFQGFVGLLAHRELMCVLGVALGLSSKQIAKEDGCSPATVDKRLLSAACKLNTSKRAHLVAEAMRLGIISFASTNTPSPENQHHDQSHASVFIA